jgi:DNA/RNA endonuclease G (NUC1)
MRTIFIMLFSVFGIESFATDYKAIILDENYDHTRFSPACDGYEKKFRAYTSCFDTKADDGESWRIPDFVSYHMKAYEGELPAGPDRPSPWITEDLLRADDEVATDAAYTYSRPFRRENPNWFVRGHLAMKQHAWRLGEAADWNTHTMLNAVPQRQEFNAGIWLDLEYKSADLADALGEVWVIAGPIFYSGEPTLWIGEPEKGESLVAVPDALFKIIVTPIGVLAYIYPQDHVEYSGRDHSQFQTTVGQIENLTGMNFRL